MVLEDSGNIQKQYSEIERNLDTYRNRLFRMKISDFFYRNSLTIMGIVFGNYMGSAISEKYLTQQKDGHPFFLLSCAAFIVLVLRLIYRVFYGDSLIQKFDDLANQFLDLSKRKDSVLIRLIEDGTGLSIIDGDLNKTFRIKNAPLFTDSRNDFQPIDEKTPVRRLKMRNSNNAIDDYAIAITDDGKALFIKYNELLGNIVIEDSSNSIKTI